MNNSKYTTKVYHPKVGTKKQKTKKIHQSKVELQEIIRERERE